MMGVSPHDQGTHDVHDARFLTRSEVADLLGVSPTTVTRWAREGRLPCRKTLGGHHRFDPDVIDQVRERMRQGEGFLPAPAKDETQ
jgi:excisionase family DNA binding protein